MSSVGSRERERDLERELRRVGPEILGLRVEISLRRFVLLARRYAPSQPRVPAGNPDGGRWTDGTGRGDDGRDDRSSDGDLALIGGGGRRRGPSSVLIAEREVEVTPGQAARFEVIRAQAAAAEAAVRDVDPRWRAPAGLYETVEGGIRQEEARLMAANARLIELGNPRVISRSFAICLTEEDQVVSWREGRASEDVFTVSAEDFSSVLSRMMRGAVEMRGPLTYDGRMFLRTDGTMIGVRESKINGVTIDLYRYDGYMITPSGKVHQK